MRINKIIIVLAIIIAGCKENKERKENVSLDIVKLDDSYFLQIKFINKTKNHIYVPKLSDLSISDNLIIYGEDGRNITEDFRYQELNDQIIRFGPPVGQVSNFCRSNYETLSERHNLDILPFTDRKETIKRMIDYEYKHLITSNSLFNLTLDDVFIIKEMIFSKYSKCIFLEPGETFEDYMTVNTLIEQKKPFKIILNSLPLDKEEQYYYHLEYSEDSIELNTILPSQFEKYKLFDKELVSNKLVMPQID